MCDCVSYVYISEVACRGGKRAVDFLEMKLQADVSHLTWVLWDKLRFSVRLVPQVNHWCLTLALMSVLIFSFKVKQYYQTNSNLILALALKQ